MLRDLRLAVMNLGFSTREYNRQYNHKITIVTESRNTEPTQYACG